MDFRILGATEVLDGTQRLKLPRGRGRALLALLVLHAGEAVPSDRLIDALWDEHPPPTATTVVQGLVSRLRRILEPDAGKREDSLLQTVGSSYRLTIDRDAVDANRFRRLIDEAQAMQPDERAAALSAALDLWRGPALADFANMPFAQRAIATLEELRVVAEEDRLEAELNLGRSRGTLPAIAALVREQPFRERLRGFLMLALYRAGRQSEALEAYREARALLVEELGVEPGVELRDLHEAILRQDPSLDLQPRRPETARGEDGDSWLPRERRSVTVVAADVTPKDDGTPDEEAVANIVARAAANATAVLERHGARVERVLGTLVIGVFGFPTAREDDALRAARAAVDVHAALGALDVDPASIGGLRPSARIGIETGDIVVRGPGTGVHDLVGTVMSAARELQQEAAHGSVVVGPAAQRLLRGAVVLQALDGSPPDGAPRPRRVLEVLSKAQAVPRAMKEPMVGRDAELTRLRSAFRRAVRSSAPVRSTVIGDAGIGKSRLAREMIASIGEARAITLTCPAPGTAFHPMRQAMVEAAGVTGWRALHDLLAADNDGQHLPPEMAAAIGLRAEDAAAEVLLASFHRLFARLSAEHPLIVVLDDLHWAEPAFLDLLDRLTKDATGPIFLLGLSRPDLLERRPVWDTDEVLRLEALPPEHLERLIRDRAGTISPEALRKIMDVSQGNPLFAEQSLAALADGADDAVPASLLGLLTMRLDRLGPAERDLLRCASIVGMEIDREAVEALVPPQARPFLQQHLETLERRRLLRGSGDRTMRFDHALIQLTAYRSMTREDRARLHERFATWLDAKPDRSVEIEASLEHHRAQAAHHRRSSGLG